MSIIPWDKVDPSESPFVRLFSLIGIPFAAGLIDFVVLTAAASSCNSGIFSNSRMLFGFIRTRSKHHLSLEVLIKWCSSFCYYWFICIIISNSIIKLHLPRCYVSVYLCNNNLDCIIYYRMGISIIAYINYHRKILSYIKLYLINFLVVNIWVTQY